MFYTYAHTKTNGTIFYIGKGQGRRAWDKHSRNRHWNFVVAKHGFEVVILGEFEDEQSALNEEVELIAHFRKFGTLVNITDGGDINPMYTKEVAMKCAATKRAKGQYTGKEMAEYNASYQNRMKDPEFAKKVSEDRKKAAQKSGKARSAKLEPIRKQIVEMYKSGASVQNIVKELSVKESFVYAALKNVEKRPKVISQEHVIASTKHFKGGKQTPEQIAKRVEARKRTMALRKQS